jgi:hypothetical protein
MASFLAIAVGLSFTLVVCLLVLRALLDPWLRIRLRSVPAAEERGNRQTAPASQSRGSAPLHTA